MACLLVSLGTTATPAARLDAEMTDFMDILWGVFIGVVTTAIIVTVVMAVNNEASRNSCERISSNGECKYLGWQPEKETL